MEILDSRLMHTNTYWLVEDNIMFSAGNFEEKQLSDDYKEMLKKEVLGIAKSKYYKDNIFTDPLEEDSILHGFVFTNSGYIWVYEKTAENSIGRKVSPGDVMFAKTMSIVSIEAEHVNFALGYNNKKPIFGSGNTSYQITATIRDDYKLKVYANSESEALEMANQVPLSEWEHPDVDVDLTDRRIIRHARWGNLSVKEV